MGLNLSRREAPLARRPRKFFDPPIHRRFLCLPSAGTPRAFSRRQIFLAIHSGSACGRKKRWDRVCWNARVGTGLSLCARSKAQAQRRTRAAAREPVGTPFRSQISSASRRWPVPTARGVRGARQALLPVGLLLTNWLAIDHSHALPRRASLWLRWNNPRRHRTWYRACGSGCRRNRLCAGRRCHRTCGLGTASGRRRWRRRDGLGRRR